MWTKNSYKLFKRYLDYFDPSDTIFDKLSKMPPIVSQNKIQNLKKELRQCEEHKRILIHSGDCAEPFEDVSKDILQNKINHYRSLWKFVEDTHNKQTTLIGRIAGQYAKPRSSQFTTHQGKKIHNYKGDNVNSLHHSDREPDSSKLFQGYVNSTIKHNFINNSMENLYISHQGLILPYEASLTAQINNLSYCLSAHMLWIGQRTRQLDGAHVEFFRGLCNPIGIKISSKINDSEFLELNHKLNPNNEQGKLIIIIRMGHKALQSKLNHLIDIKIKHKLNFLFVCDPMHGNTYETKQKKIKTRHFEHILSQIHTFQSHMKKSNQPYGLSLETSYEHVTECLGGAHPFEQHHLEQHSYKSKCDPRLNPAQLQKLIKSVKFI